MPKLILACIDLWRHVFNNIILGSSSSLSLLEFFQGDYNILIIVGLSIDLCTLKLSHHGLTYLPMTHASPTHIIIIKALKTEQLSSLATDFISNWLHKQLTAAVTWQDIELLWSLWSDIYEMFHILNCGFWNQVSYDHRSYERNLSNWV